MTCAAHRLLVGILVLVAGCASVPPPLANQASYGVAEQQILVMVKERAVRHYRPGPESLPGMALQSGACVRKRSPRAWCTTMT